MKKNFRIQKTSFVMKVVFISGIVITFLMTLPVLAYKFERNYIPRNKHEIMKIKEMLKLDEVKYLVIHETANESVGADAYAHLNYCKESAELFTQVYVDDKNVIQVAPLETMLWHTGQPTGEKNINNSNSIGIEMCVDTKLDNDGNPSETLTREAREKTYSNTIRYIKDYILPQYPDIEIVMHNHVWEKECPRYILQENRWDEFLERVYSRNERDATNNVESINIANKEETFEEYFEGKSPERLQEIIDELENEIDNSVKIMGFQELDINQAADFIFSNNPNPKLKCSVNEWLETMNEACRVADVNPIVPVAQSLLETGFFSFNGIVSFEQNNFSGHGSTGLIKSDGSVETGSWFETPKDGIYAQVVHLAGYASSDESKIDKSYDNRFSLLEGKRGFCPTVYSLARNSETDEHYWAYDTEYGLKIENMINNLLNYKPEKAITIEKSDLVEIKEDLKFILDDGLVGNTDGKSKNPVTIIEY